MAFSASDTAPATPAARESEAPKRTPRPRMLRAPPKTLASGGQTRPAGRGRSRVWLGPMAPLDQPRAESRLAARLKEVLVRVEGFRVAASCNQTETAKANKMCYSNT